MGLHPNQSGTPSASGSTGAQAQTGTGNPPKKLKRLIEDEVIYDIYRDIRLRIKAYDTIKYHLTPLEPDDPAFLRIYKYVREGQVPTFGIRILSIIRVTPKDPQPQVFPAIGNRMMLWHGLTNRGVVTTFQEGFKPQPHIWWRKRGTGIYFTDRIANSCQYSPYWMRTKGGKMAKKTMLGWVPADTHYMFLCDVHLGDKMRQLVTGRTVYKVPPPDLSTGQSCTVVKYVGNYMPDPKENETIDGSVWPLGENVANTDHNANQSDLIYNEFVVYNSAQIQPKYLVRVKFTSFPVYEKVA